MNHCLSLSCIDLLSIGRSGEAAFVNYAMTHVDPIEQIMYTTWSEPKVSKQSMMTFYPDFDKYAIDWYFLAGCYFTCGGGYHYTQNQAFNTETRNRIETATQHRSCAMSLLFPYLQKDGAAKVNNIMKVSE